MVQIETMRVQNGISRREFGWGVIAASVAGAGCWAEPVTSAASIPKRIVSTAPSSTEALFALGLGKNVVGVSNYCEYPPEVKLLPKIGSYVKPDVEAIAYLRPDLVVLQKHTGPMTRLLDTLHLRYVELPFGTLSDVYTGIDLLGKATGVPERGAALDEKIRASLAAVKAKSDRVPKSRVLVIADRRAGMLADITAVGPSNYVNEMIEIAGGVNVLAQSGLPMYPHISLETIIHENPDVIVDLTDSHDTDAAHERVRAEDLALWGGHPELKAVKTGRVKIGQSVVLLVPGPRSPEAAEMFYQYFHGAK